MSHRAKYQRACVFCGRPFKAVWPNALVCSHTCQTRAWRAVVMLAGTHGYVNERFVRLPSKDRAA